jgi:hypothetical protein
MATVVFGMARWQVEHMNVRERSIISVKAEKPQFEIHSPS